LFFEKCVTKQNHQLILLFPAKDYIYHFYLCLCLLLRLLPLFSYTIDSVFRKSE
jgi:hypothetical protein